MHDAKFPPTKYRSDIRPQLQNCIKTSDGPSHHLTLRVKSVALQEDRDTYEPSENTLTCVQNTQTSYVRWYQPPFMVHESLTDANWGRTDDFEDSFV